MKNKVLINSGNINSKVLITDKKSKIDRRTRAATMELIKKWISNNNINNYKQ